MDEDGRAMSPAVGKAIEVTIVVLYVGLVGAVVYGGAVPAYQTAAGEEVAERTLADAATDIESAVPPEARDAEVSVDVELPGAIDGAAYRIAVIDRRLVLEHPNPAIATEVELVLSERVVEISGTWESGEKANVRVTTTDTGVEVYLE